MRTNPAHTLDSGIPSLLHIERNWPAASDEQRWTERAAARNGCPNILAAVP
jgi:hypothetical protein